MSGWKSFLHADPTNWLLEESDPSVRYMTLVDILDTPAGSREAIKARKSIMLNGPVSRILDAQETRGYWGAPGSFYTAKYKGTVWQLIILAALSADGKDKRIRESCEFLLENSQDRESGGFSMHRSASKGGGRHSEVIPCLTGNMVHALISLGYPDDPRVQRGIDWIAEYQRFDDGIEDPPQGWPYDKYEICWGTHTCHMGAVKALKALAELPTSRISFKVHRKIHEGIEYLLRHHIHKQSHDLSRVARPGWLKFGYPLMYQTDVLEILGILAKLGCRDNRMQEAVDAVIRQQDSNGRWKLANTFNGKFLVDIETKGKPSKWITLNALRVLKGFYG
jgi:hypothetical protein